MMQKKKIILELKLFTSDSELFIQKKHGIFSLDL